MGRLSLPPVTTTWKAAPPAPRAAQTMLFVPAGRSTLRGWLSRKAPALVLIVTSTTLGLEQRKLTVCAAAASASGSDLKWSVIACTWPTRSGLPLAGFRLPVLFAMAISSYLLRLPLETDRLQLFRLGAEWDESPDCLRIRSEPSAGAYNSGDDP